MYFIFSKEKICAYVVSVIVILFGAGIKKRYIISTILVIVISVPLLYKFVLPDYMKKRIDDITSVIDDCIRNY